MQEFQHDNFDIENETLLLIFPIDIIILYLLATARKLKKKIAITMPDYQYFLPHYQ